MAGQGWPYQLKILVSDFSFFFDDYSYVKNVRDHLIRSGGIDDQRNPQLNWTRKFCSVARIVLNWEKSFLLSYKLVNFSYALKVAVSETLIASANIDELIILQFDWTRLHFKFLQLEILCIKWKRKRYSNKEWWCHVLPFLGDEIEALQ